MVRGAEAASTLTIGRMNADQLRAAQAPLKAGYRENPVHALVTLRAQAALSQDDVACRIETGKGRVTAGLHPAAGGDGSLACPGDMLLEALAACAGVTLRAVATALAIPVEEGSVTAEGDLDFRGTLGVSKETAVGFTAIRLRFDLRSSASEEQLSKLIALTERYCVVYQTLLRPPRIEVSRRAD
jgi:uncharacterized OsmC-like protein